MRVVNPEFVGKVIDVYLMNTICEVCYEPGKELQILITVETKDGKQIGKLVCAECSTKFKIGDFVV